MMATKTAARATMSATPSCAISTQRCIGSPPLGDNIPHILATPMGFDDAPLAHALQGVADGLLWLHVCPDLLRAQAFGMRREQRQDALAQGTGLPAALVLRRWL